MALSRARRRETMNYWPGFVDALSTLLLVFTFLLSVFVMSQYFLTRDVGGKDKALTRLNRQIEELTELLALEKGGKAEAQKRIATLTANLEATRRERDNLYASVAAGAGNAATAIAAQKRLSAGAQATVDLLNQQIAALRSQLASVQEALSASEAKDKDSQARIADLGSRLNVALAQKVQELARYRSDFFGRLREILGDNPDVKVVGDRFVLPSEVLFDRAKASLSPQGKAQIDKVAAVLADVAKEIPPDIPWVLRVDGHTDKKRIRSAPYKSNWELSAARSLAVVEYLIGKGFDPHHILAGAYGDQQPIDDGDSEEALRRNRRIELKITER
jgi:chemotaxis protein MotB